MSLRRVRFLAFVPLALAAYACSDDDSSSPGGGVDAGLDTSIPVPGPDTDGSAELDAGVVDDAASDANDDASADATVPASCSGNPLGDGDAGLTVDSDGGALITIATGHFLDGPRWVDDGILYSEVTSQAIVRNAPDGGARTLLRATGASTDLPIGNGRTGNFIYTALARTTPGGKGAILRMLLDGGEPTAFDAGEANSPNGLVASSKGFVYFTDPGFQNDGVSTGVYRLAPDGTLTTITKIDGGVNQRADGIALNADESALFVGYYDQKRIARYTLDAGGDASNPVNLDVTLVDGPTGLAIDTAGNIWVAESPNDGSLRGRVEVFSPTGQKWGEIPLNDSRATGVAFGGADSRTVYITSERGSAGEDGTLYAFTSRCPGVR